MYAEMALRNEGMKILINNLGKVEAERFISLIIREPFDCIAKGTCPALQGVIKGMYPRTCGTKANTLPKQHTPSLQGGVVDYTEWQRGLFNDLSIKELSGLAMKEYKKS